MSVHPHDLTRPMIVDSFAGGGGASTGIEMALGRSPDVAINHSDDALAMHEVNQRPRAASRSTATSAISRVIDRRPDGSPLSATVQGSCCGNSVCPPIAAALVSANCAHLMAAPVMEAAE